MADSLLGNIYSQFFNAMEETMSKGNFIRDRKFILRFLYIIMFFLLATVTFIPERFNLVFFLLLYIFISIVTFIIALQWVCTLTLFLIFYTTIALGFIYSEIEHATLYYDPYIVILGGYMICILGYWIAKKIKLQFPKLKKIQLKMGIMSWNFTLYLGYLFASIMWVIYFLKNHSLLMNNLQTGRVEAMSGNGIFLYSIQLFIMIIPLMYQQVIENKINKYIFGILAVIAILELLLLGYRTPAFMVIVIVMIITILNSKINLMKAISLGIIIVVLAGIYGSVRGEASNLDLYYMFRSKLYVGMTNLNYMFYYFPNIVKFEHGHTYLINIMMLKPGSDLDFTLWLKETINMSFDGGGITPTILGEFYINFGLVGIFIGMFALGVIFECFDRCLNKRNVGFWKAFIMLELASCCGGGISNVYLLPIIFSIVYYFMNIVAIDSPYSYKKVYN